jgi:hypothetical protein
MGDFEPVRVVVNVELVIPRLIRDFEVYRIVGLMIGI